ncbi:MAG: response regulator [Verrucomicrobia bacterium]|nr:response regulator [Verrucomicrobiota bacterium]
MNVAVVDDDESFACALGRLFRAAGLEAQTFASAEAFLAAAPLPPPDCLVLDIHLGGMSGLELQRRLRADGNPVPIIFVTAHDVPENRRDAEQGGCAAYFLKPVSRASIVDAIHAAAHQPQ